MWCRQGNSDLPNSTAYSFSDVNVTYSIFATPSAGTAVAAPTLGQCRVCLSVRLASESTCLVFHYK